MRGFVTGSMTEQDAYIGFSAFPGIGPQRFKLLIEYFGSAEKAWNASEETLFQIGLGGKLTQKFVRFRDSFKSEDFIHDLQSKEIGIVSRIDPAFPQPLLQIPDPPIALYLKGKLSSINRSIGVVGTRKVTSYGREVTEKIVRDLVSCGFVVVSGMARGVDGIAHRIALEMGAPTIAVLGCGVDIIYPPEHKELYHHIIEKGGAIVSEVPPGHTVIKGLFPARNRIISGLTLGIVVTEGAKDSGSLITARYAAEQGREVFAVPGPITSYLSAGPTKLIKQGAKLVTEVDDILEELNIERMQRSKIKDQSLAQSVKRQLNGIEQKIVDFLSQGEKHYDEIVRESGLAAQEVGSLLTQMELSGILKALGNGKYGLR